MEQKLKQRICIDFCVKLQISATETFEMLNKAFPNDTPKRTTQDTGIFKTTIGRIVTEDLRLKKTPAKFIPRFLTNEQKLCRLATCEDMLEMTRTDPEWKDKIITGDETWVYGYDPETKRQSAEWRGQGEPRPKKSRILKSRNKVLLVAFSDNKGIVHHEYLPAGQTVIKEMYLGILRRLREAIRKKRPEKWTNGDWILHHDNARPHTAHLVTSILAKNGTEILPQPPYSSDIAPNDFFLFPKLKAVLKGRHFDTREDIIEKSLLALKSIPKEAYKNCFDNWEKRWRCTDFFNGDLHGISYQVSLCHIDATVTSDSRDGITEEGRQCALKDLKDGNDWILHVGNARPHTAHVVLQFLANHLTIQIPHPPYSPDLAPNDFFLYLKLKMNLKGRKFDNVDMIQAESKATLRNLSKSDFISCFDNWEKRWNGCIEAGGAYFEKY
ncbi:hypothetical protein LAZ67_18002278 [Cordylochernes scorpioides]|uniref:Transposase n=1 Tax=Cordylochernes scorpioides TaxID=51811 RepID=A0ABY6LGH2_9ARAC|nr:hypothetical protein LAZ67_18002278 [Cordylochernes scorpioides]